MHLSTGDALSSGGSGGPPVRARTTECRENGVHGTHRKNGHCSEERVQLNEIVVSRNPGLVDAVVAAWILLVHRYQRDAFHHFTWGVEGTGEAEMHHVQAQHLDLHNIRTVEELLQVGQRVKSQDSVSRETEFSTLTFLDGTEDGVRQRGTSP